MEDFLIFLGAGASTEFGIPAIQPMTHKFKATYTRYTQKINLIITNLMRVGFVPTIENILSYVRGQANPKATLISSSPFVANFFSGQASSRLGYDPGAKTMIKDLQEFIAQKCLVTEDYRVEMIKKHYSRFFAYLKRRFQLEGQLEDGSISVDIFTTNYDNVIEQYALIVGINIFTGYEPVGDGTCRFSPELYDSQGPIRLYKLHGSVTLGMVENKLTKKISVIESTAGLRIGDAYRKDWKVVDRVMIHGYEKDPSQEPYFDLLYLLKDKLKKIDNAIVIGYSFSDRPILNVFRDALNSRGDDFRITLLNRRASKIKKSHFAAYGRRIRVRNTSFHNFRRI